MITCTSRAKTKGRIKGRIKGMAKGRGRHTLPRAAQSASWLQRVDLGPSGRMQRMRMRDP